MKSMVIAAILAAGIAVGLTACYNKEPAVEITMELHEVSCGFNTYLIPIPSNANIQTYSLGYCTAMGSYLTD